VTGITQSTDLIKAGESASFTITLSDNVTVSGTPTLSLSNGGTATYESGSGSKDLVFNYVAAAGQDSSDVTITAFNYAGSTLVNAINRPASLDGVVGNPVGILAVDTLAPVVAVTSIGSVGTASVVSSVAGDATIVGTAEANSTVTITSGATVLGTATTNGSGQFTYTLTETNIATLNQGAGKSITVAQTDAAGNTGTSAAASFSIDTIAPVVAVSAAASNKTNTALAKAGDTITASFTSTDTVTSVTSGGIFLMCSRDPTPISPTASTGSSLTPQVPPSPPSYFHTSILKIQMQRSNGTAFHSTKDSPLEYRTNQRHVFSRRPSGATLPMLYDMVWLLRWNIIS
jgi:hypothetical protein